MARSGFADLMAICAVIPAGTVVRGRCFSIEPGISRFRPRVYDRPGMTQREATLRPRPLVADGQQFHRTVRDDDPEGGADGAFDQLDVAAMGADELGGDREAEPAAAGAAGGLKRLEQMLAGLVRHARA